MVFNNEPQSGNKLALTIIIGLVVIFALIQLLFYVQKISGVDVTVIDHVWVRHEGVLWYSPYYNQMILVVKDSDGNIWETQYGTALPCQIGASMKIPKGQLRLYISSE